jgi:phosphoglycerate dehydrogenase-like enzyme
VATPFLLERRDAWDEGYELIDPADHPDGLPAALAQRIEVVVTGGDDFDARLVDRLPRLKLVACFSTGYASIDAGSLRARGIALTTAAGANAHDVADHALALLLAAWHQIPQGDRRVREGRWRDRLVPRPSLAGRTAGIVGLGRIGSHIASRLEGFGVHVRWWGPREKPGVRWPRAASVLALARDSDLLIVSGRSSPENAGLVDREALAALGPGGLLVNVSRGFLVDEPALLQALRDRTIAGAALDVFEPEPPDAARWRDFDNVILSPHVAGYTREGGAAMFAQLRENVRRHFAGQGLFTPLHAH